MTVFKVDAKEIRRRAKGQWGRVFNQLAPSLSRAVDSPGKHVPCPVHSDGSTGDGFRLHRHDGLEEGVGICNTCDAFLDGGLRKFRDGFGILQWINSGWTFPETLERVAEIVAPDLIRGGKRRYIQQTPAPVVKARSISDIEEALREDQAAVARMSTVWASGIPITSSKAKLAQRYFESRGLPAPTSALDGAMRFLPRLRHYDDQTKETTSFPGIVSLVTDRLGNGVAVHRTYLAHDGYGKAPIDCPKKLMSTPRAMSITGGCIKLGPASGVIALAEGIETALAVSAFTGHTCWSTVSSTFMRSWTPSDGIHTVHIFGDYDRSGDGQSAAKTLAERLSAEGFTVAYDVPEGEIPEGSKSIDWADVYNRHGGESIFQVPSIRKSFLSRGVNGGASSGHSKIL